MSGRRSSLAVPIIGLGALIVGVGRLAQAYREQDPAPDLVPIPVLLASVAFGLVITILTVRAGAIIFLDNHPRLRPAQLWLAVIGASFVLALAYVAGAAYSRS
jgi:hypothetical protein